MMMKMRRHMKEIHCEWLRTCQASPNCCIDVLTRLHDVVDIQNHDQHTEKDWIKFCEFFCIDYMKRGRDETVSVRGMKRSLYI
jgi:hypothetical protein